MPEKIQIPDQDDVLATNERHTTELQAASELLETAQADLNVATQRATDLAGRVATLETAAKVAGEELTRAKTENADLTAKMADFQKAVAAEVVKLGLNPKAAEHKPAPEDKDLTPTQRVLLAKGVSSLAELRRMRST